MNPHLLLQAMGFSLILLSSPMAEASADDDDDDPKMVTCEPARCGNVIDIHYPFWLNGSNQSSYCGFPQFEIYCDSDSPILYMSYSKYIIKKIFYNNQSLLISNPNFLDANDCPSKLRNVIFNLTPFSISPANMDLFFFHNCPGLLPHSHSLGCNSSGLLAYLGEHVDLSSYCEGIVVPAIGFPGASGRDYAELLRNGFLANWAIADCSECSGSEGQCGYNRKKDRFMCICSDGAHDISCSPTGKDNGKLIAIGVSVGVASLIVACVLFFFCWRCKKRRTSTSSNFLVVRNVSSDPSSLKDPEFGSMNYHTHLFSYEELQEATNGFDESREVGDGGFGTVYKGKLRDGRIVAVKRLYENNYKRVEQFMNEIEILSHLRHENLVALYGCTSRHSRELLLVYEFVSNGTVADHLHGSRASSGALTWAVRLNIAIESACALAYLHAVEPQIIHRDVKTNNILLDDGFHVKVADFGLSRLFPVNASHVSTLPQGTPGYVDPEYHQCYQLTDKSDVYSFGVVLVELVSSLPAVDISRHRHEINLANMAINRIQSCKLEELIDPGLGHRTDKEIERMITMVAELAFRCLQGDKDMRPCIKEVLQELERIRGTSDNAGKGAADDELAREESQLLKNLSPFSPDSVTVRWDSSLTTPNASE